MTDHETHEQEARDQLASRIAEMDAYLRLGRLEVDVYDDDEMGKASNQELYSLADYGLEWTKATTNHRDGTVTYVHVLSTGGPGDEFQVEFDENGNVRHWLFVYLPWGDRVEINCGDGNLNDDGAVTDFYASFYGDIIDQEGR
jgi:hypothetical protein